jgi:hypothetical protein
MAVFAGKTKKSRQKAYCACCLIYAYRGGAMSAKDTTSVLLQAFVLLSVGGLMLHIRIHPLGASLFNCIPVAFGAINILILPFLFRRAGTAPLAFLLCCATVAAGTIGMAYFSIVEWKEPVTLYTVLFKSTLADIIILAAKVPLGYELLRQVQSAAPEAVRGMSSDA